MLDCYYGSVTYVPGAFASGGYSAFPIEGGSFEGPDLSLSHFVQSGHQEPGHRVAVLNHSSESFVSDAFV